LISGSKVEVEQLKTAIKREVNINNIGTVKRHLGVDYEMRSDDKGMYWTMSMNAFVKEIVRDVEAVKGKHLRSYYSPGFPGCQLLPSKDELKNHAEYRSIVGKVLCLVKKVDRTCNSAIQELSLFLECPSDKHWASVYQIAGYLCDNYEGLKLRAPSELRVVAWSDSDWSNDKTDRKSISGYILAMGGCIVDWRTKKQTCVALS
jgi:hypothetical protein